MNLLRAAILYAERFGWSTFPVAGKVPLTEHGFQDASRESDALRRLFADTRATGVGIACGASNLVVVDLDGEEGRASWADLCARSGGHGRTLVAETGKPQGLHLYFRGDGRNSCRKLGDGIDTRGAGGYVVAPPSLHQSGRRYRWRDPQAPLAPLPSWLAELLKPPHPPLIVERRELKEGICATAYGHASLLGLAEEMLSTTAGRRNERLVRLAYRVGRLSAGGELDAQTAADVLLEAAVRTGLPPHEAMRTIASGIRAGEHYPLAVTE